MKNINKYIYAVIAGFLCLVLSRYNISYIVGNIPINIPWSLIFPILVSLSFGRKAGIVTAFSGGAFYPFYLWPNNGYAHIVNLIVLVLLFYLLGFISDIRVKYNNTQKANRTILIVIVSYITIYIPLFLFLYRWLLSFNPPFWTSHVLTYLPLHVVVTIVAKDLVNFILISVFCDTLLRIPQIRKLFAFKNRLWMKGNSKIFIQCISLALVIWATFFLLDNLLSHEITREKDYLVLSLMVIFWSSSIIASWLIKQNETKQKAIIKSENYQKQLQSILNNVPSVIYRGVNDDNLSLLMISEKMVEITGHKDSDFLKQGSITLKDIIHPDDVLKTITSIKEQLKNNQYFEAEYRILDKKGHTHWIVNRGNANMDETNNNILIDGVIVDNTEKKMIWAEMEKARLKAEESDRLKSAFLANMSHEIRTPMNGILGFADLLGSDKLTVKKREYYANIVKSSSQQLLNIISDIIDISKIEAEEFTLSETTFSLNEFLNEIIEQSSILLKQKNKNHLKLFSNKIDESILVTTDRNRLSQIMLNLVTNAIKFTNKGQIKIGGEKIDKTFWMFYVEDTGIGIDKNMHKLIFERFRQANNTSFQSGTGLGLSICKALVENMGGNLQVDSEPSVGSKFYFTIKQGIAKNTVKQPEEKNTSNHIKRKAKILIAEDEEINYVYLYEILNSAEFELLHAENGKTAVELFKKENPDIVLLDIKMPVMNGYKALHEILQLNTEIPVIAVTAYAMSSDEKKALEAGFKAYLSKPVSKEKLLSVINQFL